MIAWGEWAPCEGGHRVRTEYVVTQPVGAGLACRELYDEDEGLTGRELLALIPEVRVRIPRLQFDSQQVKSLRKGSRFARK